METYVSHMTAVESLHQYGKGKAVPLHAMEALGGEEV
jgi:hypothetical protein